MSVVPRRDRRARYGRARAQTTPCVGPYPEGRGAGRRLRSAGIAATVLAAAPLVPALDSAPPNRARTVRVAAGARYEAGAVHRFLLGTDYRPLWATPIEVEVLDLRRFSGGLRPKEKGGGKQTRSLRFEAGDGREWRVRSVDKDATDALPRELRGGLLDRVAQDQISASHPGAALVTDVLAGAAGLRHVEHRLVVVPDDPELGRFREEFGGMLGVLEEVPKTERPVTPGFEGLEDLLETDELWERLARRPTERVDSRLFLKARLLDMIVGDYDRHQGQWSWARRRGSKLWEPVPEDRDLAFVRFNGLVPGIARFGQPRLVQFGDDYPKAFGLAWQSRFVDRRHLADLDWSEWEPVVGELQRAIGDEVIEAAVRRLPPEYRRLDGARLAAALKRRVELLPGPARGFYELLAREVEVHGSDEAELAEITRREDGRVEVVVRPIEANGGEASFRRSFDPEETSEVRVFLNGGDDRAVVQGRGRDDVAVHVVGGGGADTLDDSRGGETRFHDDSGENRILSGPGTRVRRAPFAPPRDGDGNPLRDWGGSRSAAAWLSEGDIGLRLGAELRATDHSFRRHPYASRHTLALEYAPERDAGRAEYAFDVVGATPRDRRRVSAGVSELDVLWFHGFGNETSDAGPSDAFEVDRRAYTLGVESRFDLRPLQLTAGIAGSFATTRERTGSVLAAERPYGFEDFGQVGVRFALDLDRTQPASGRGVRARITGEYVPPLWSVSGSFGRVGGETRAYLEAPLPLRPVLALRVGGERVFGRYPYHEAAFLGGPSNIRGLRRQRYAGDATLFGTTELRVRLGRVDLLVPTEVGVVGFVDVGRVFLDGERSQRWHSGPGGGLWLGLPGQPAIVSLTVASSEGNVRFLLHGGFAF